MSQSFILPKWPPKLLVVRINNHLSAFFCSFSKIIINHHFSNASYLALLFFTGIILFSPSMTISLVTIDITILGNPIAPDCMTTFEILLGNLEIQGYQRKNMDVPLLKPTEMILLLAVISYGASRTKESKSVSKAPTNSNLTSFVSQQPFGKLVSTH
jgi:hypothetical protein